MSAELFRSLVIAFLSIYSISSVFSFILRKNENLSNIVVNSINSLNSILGIYISILFLYFGTEKIEVLRYDTGIPLINFSISFDSISAYFILAMSILTLATSIYSIGYMGHYFGKKSISGFGFLNTSFILTMAMVFTASNLILFFIAWELMSLASYFLVSFEHEKEDARNAGVLYLIMTHIGALFLLLGFMIIYSVTGSFDMASLSSMSPNVKSILLVLFFIGFGTKAGLVPLHIWLPYAHPAAPSNISALMSGIMLKTAFYGIIRFAFDMIKVDFSWFGTLLIVVGLSSVILAAAYMYLESNIKRLLAYSSIENMGIITIGIGVAAIAQASSNNQLFILAITASMFHLFSHVMFKGLLFLSAGSVHFSTGTKDLERLGGLMKVMPFTGFLFVLGGMAMSAIVPLNGFAGEWLTLQSLFMGIGEADAITKIVIILAVATIGAAGAFSCGSAVRMIGIAFLGKPRTKEAADAIEVPKSMIAAKSILASMCILMGILPFTIINLSYKAFCVLWAGSGVTTHNLKGFLFVPWQPLEVSKSSIMPMIPLVLIASVILVVLVVLRVLNGKQKYRSNETWNCGYSSSTPRMQYTSTGYSNPMGIVLRMIFKPKKEMVVEKGSTPYDIRKIYYFISNQKLFETIFYNPVKKVTLIVSNFSKDKVQTGSMRGYLSYIFFFTLILLILNRLI